MLNKFHSADLEWDVKMTRELKVCILSGSSASQDDSYLKFFIFVFSHSLN